MNNLSLLLQIARELGASEAVIVASADIILEESLAARCREHCQNYGLAKGCPPHIAGPSAFRNLLKNHPRAIFFRIDVPAGVLFSNESREVFQLLHEVASGIEHSATAMGCADARAFAGGSCKEIFCRENKDCAALTGNGACRYPVTARPSMSGCGVDVAKLFQTVGWEMNWATRNPDADPPKMASVCGLVLIGKPELDKPE